jgi:cytosine/uracil/thiamine/allantoin permease
MSCTSGSYIDKMTKLTRKLEGLSLNVYHVLMIMKTRKTINEVNRLLLLLLLLVLVLVLLLYIYIKKKET